MYMLWFKFFFGLKIFRQVLNFISLCLRSPRQLPAHFEIWFAQIPFPQSKNVVQIPHPRLILRNQMPQYHWERDQLLHLILMFYTVNMSFRFFWATGGNQDMLAASACKAFVVLCSSASWLQKPSFDL